jgi:tol-pal system protein YbgF
MNAAQRLRSGLTMAAVLATAVVALPASAQRLSLAERVERLEQQQTNGQGGSAVDLVNQINALQSQVQSLQGQVEELKHQLDEAKQRSKDQYIDLDSRIGHMEGRAGGGAPPPAPGANARDNAQPPDIELGGSRAEQQAPAPPPGARDVPQSARGNVGELHDDERGDLNAPPNPRNGGASQDRGAPPADAAGEQPTYDAAFAALKDGRYAESARRFQAFLDQYPSSGLASNAYYWLGESYYVTQNYKIALQSFQTLLQRYPGSQKAPDALLKVGYSQYELKQWDQAEATLNQVVQTYPDTTVAHLAQGRLRALKSESRR